MLHRFATVAATCMLVTMGTAPIALADPPADPPAVPVADAAAPPPPPPGGPLGPVPSAPPGLLTTPDGWKLSVTARTSRWNRSPRSPVHRHRGSTSSTAPSSAPITGGGRTKLAGGTLEAGYQIGCGIIQDDIESITSVGITPGVGIPLVSGSLFPITLGSLVNAADQDRPQARHGQHRPGRQEVVQGHQLARLDHRLPHQDRRLRRTVLHPVVRDPDQLD